jgi:hypothetical protein
MHAEGTSAPVSADGNYCHMMATNTSISQLVFVVMDNRIVVVHAKRVFCGAHQLLAISHLN